MKRGLLATATLLFVTTACPGPSATDAGTDAGSGGQPSVTSIDPDHGPVAGGTLVTINGSNFANGASVVFGTTASATVTFVDAHKLSATSPPAPEGRASITVVNPGGRQATLPGAFNYQGTSSGTIADALALNPANGTDTSGIDPLKATVRGQVKVPGVTDATGQGMGVRAQVGFALDGTTLSFTWIDAAYSTDADVYDVYQGDVTLPTPMAMQVVTYVLGVRFSVDNGQSWVEGDRDGSVNGVQDTQRPRITVSRKPVDWCKLGGEQISAPDAFNLLIGQAGPTIYGQVYAAGVTDQVDAGIGIAGELGLGDAGTDPATWVYAPATFNRDTASGANDEFMATLPTGAAFAGDHHFAFRFNLNGGPWRYCDSDGLTNGFTDAQAGSLHLTGVGIDQCRLQFPITLQSRQGVAAGPVYGRVLARTVTEDAGQGAGIEGALGYGPVGTLPSNASWTWTAASFNVDAAGGQDEYQAQLVGPAPGAYVYAYRFRYAGGAWTYCDSDPTDGVIVPAQLGQLTAQAATFKAIASCKLQLVDRASVASGDQVTAYGRVLVPGWSPDAGATVGLVGQVGVGTQGDNASTSSSWGWGPATFGADIVDSGEDEYVATFRPAYSGTRAVSFRFSVDDGGWTYCDLNGSDVNGYEVAQQWNLNVGNPTIDFCKLQYPPTADAGTIVYGQIYIAGVTPAPGADPSISAELGWGHKVEDPGVAESWTWIPASYNAGCTSCGANNDEYQAVLGALPDAGHYAYRFSRNGSYCYADLDGAGPFGGFNGDTQTGGENLGVVTR